MNNKIEEIQTKLNQLQDELDKMKQPERWPQIGDYYVYIMTNNTTSMMTIFNNSGYDKYLKAIGNMFHTIKEAKYHKDMQLLAGAIKADNSFVPDWKNPSQTKWFISWNCMKGERTYNYSNYERLSVLVFKDRVSIEKAFKNISDEDLKYMIERGLL